MLAAAALTAALYLSDLTGMGLVSKDEPRYADIGRAMARTGDWIDPRLWGQPWFEKPPLLYWLVGLGFKAGLGPELAPRLPVALLSLAFLVFFWFRLRSLWDERVANCSTAILATTAGWLALSHVAITDLPVSALFTAAVLLGVGDRRPILAAAALGFAVLAKSLPPLILFLPVLGMDYRRWRDWIRPAPILIFLGVTVPWHAVVWMRNGYEFFRVLFLEQQLGRFFTPERQHGQPWWYYLPVLLLLLFPWFPLLVVAAARWRELWRDEKTRTLFCVVVFGMIFFSRSLNKLPGYILPLIPSICIFMGIGLARLSRPGFALIFPVALLGAFPFALAVVPVAVATRLTAAPLPWTTLVAWICVALTLGIFLNLVPSNGIVEVVFAFAGVAYLCFQFQVFPAIDRLASARPVWRERHLPCAPGDDRGLLYGLSYYSGSIVPPCDILDRTPKPVLP